MAWWAELITTDFPFPLKHTWKYRYNINNKNIKHLVVRGQKIEKESLNA
jgi:hypothetical protein